GGRAVKSAVVDAPVAGVVLPGYSVQIAGSAVASKGVIDRIEILHGDVVVRTAPLPEARANRFRAFGSSTVKFRTRVNLLDLPRQPTLRVVIRVGDERLELAELVFRREPLRVSPPPPIHP